MKIRVTLMTENDIDINDIEKAYGMSKEEIMDQAKALWNIAALQLANGKDRCSCESVELVEK